jgi:hypothetical protein
VRSERVPVPVAELLAAVGAGDEEGAMRKKKQRVAGRAAVDAIEAADGFRYAERWGSEPRAKGWCARFCGGGSLTRCRSVACV